MYRLDRAGVLTTVAGTGTEGFSGDGGPAAQAQLDQPAGVAVDAAGNLYIADAGNGRIRRLDRNGTITSVAGIGRPGPGDGEPATAALLEDLEGVAVDGAGNLYIPDEKNDLVRRVDTKGIITTVAGSGDWGDWGDRRRARDVQLRTPVAVAVDSAGNLYIAEGDRVRRVDTQGMITTVAGFSLRDSWPGDDLRSGPATEVHLDKPHGLPVDRAGNLYIAEGNRVRRVDPKGMITTVAGRVRDQLSGESPGDSSPGDGGPATQAVLQAPHGLAVDSHGNLYIAERYGGRIRRVDHNGIITTVAGTGTDGFAGDGGPATRAMLYNPEALAFDADGNLIFTDEGNERVRRIDRAGVITTVAGTGVDGFHGDGGPAIEALLNSPAGLAIDVAGNLYVADHGNDRVRRIDRAGIITTLAGKG